MDQAAIDQLAAFQKNDPAGWADMLSQLGMSGGDGDEDGDGPGAGVPPALAELLATANTGSAPSREPGGPVGEDELRMPGGGGVLGSDGKARSNQAGIDITPLAGYAVKTKRLDDDSSKVFINVCSHEAVSEPAIKKKLDDDGNEVEGINVPVSVGPLRADVDKNGKPCETVDVVVNPKVLEDVEEDTTGAQRNFITQLCIEYVEQKSKVPLDRQYKLPRLKSKGAPVVQRVRDVRKEPSIQEVSGKTKPSKRSAAARPHPASVRAPPVRPIASVLRYVATADDDAAPRDVAGATPTAPVVLAAGGDDADAAREGDPRLAFPALPPGADRPHALVATATFSRTDVDGTYDAPPPPLANLTVDASAFQVRFSAPGYAPARLSLPFAVLPDDAQCVYNASTGALVVTLPVDPSPYAAGPDPGSQPWLLARALGDDGDAGEADRKGGTASERKAAAAAAAAAAPVVDTSPEARFHLRAATVDTTPENSFVDRPVDSVTEDTELPEDRFHKKDAMSSHLIESAARDRREKIEKSDREREERKAAEPDENIEYIDTEDFQPGGKYGPTKKAVEEKAALAADHVAAQAAAAAAVVAADPNIEVRAQAASAVAAASTAVPALSSKKWSMLLD